MRRVAISVAAVLVVTACSTGGLPVEGGERALDLEVTPVGPSPVDGRADAAVAWTGEEYVVVGGVLGEGKFGADGEPESADDGPVDADGQPTVEGAAGTVAADAFDPTTGVWRQLPRSPLPARSRATAIWSGREVVVWSGTARRDGVGDLLDAAAYDPATDRWRELPDSPPGTDRSNGQGVVLGTKFVVMGGGTTPSAEGEGQLVVLDVEAGTWQVLARPDAVVHLHRDQGGTVWIVREQQGDGPDDAPARSWTVTALEEVDGQLVETPAVLQVDDPTDPDSEERVHGAGLVSVGRQLALVLEIGNGPSLVYDVPTAGPSTTSEVAAPVEVEGLGVTGSGDMFGVRPVLAADGAVAPWALGSRTPRVAIDPLEMRARAVVADDDEVQCVNGLSWAGDGAGGALLVGAECEPELVSLVARGS